MKLGQAFQRVLGEYPSSMKQAFAGHPLANFLRNELPQLIREKANLSSEYQVEGSAGQGQWTRSPWVAILDPLVTNSAQRGYYPVYLFREDFSGLYLSLNQGVTDVRKIYGSRVKDALRTRAADYRARLGNGPVRVDQEEIDLRPSTTSGYSADYEAGNIYAKLYEQVAGQPDSELLADLDAVMALYHELSYKESLPSGTVGVEDDERENPVVEDYALFRYHKRIERNPEIASKVKKIHGYKCEACGFAFEEMYTGIPNPRYIEAHHLVPISTLKGRKVKLDPKTDFAVLCANCHRMIHRYESPGDLGGFRNAIKINHR